MTTAQFSSDSLQEKDMWWEPGSHGTAGQQCQDRDGIVQGSLRKSNIWRQVCMVNSSHRLQENIFSPTDQSVYLLPQGHSEDFCNVSPLRSQTQLLSRPGKEGISDPAGLLKAWVPCLWSHLVPFPHWNIFAFHFLQRRKFRSMEFEFGQAQPAIKWQTEESNLGLGWH